MRTWKQTLKRVAVASTIATAGWAGTAGAAQAVDYDIESFSVEALKVTSNPGVTPAVTAPYTQASGHPDLLAVKVRFNSVDGLPGPPVEELKDLEIELPEGIQGNPTATPRCKLSDNDAIAGTVFHCPDASIVGYQTLWWTAGIAMPDMESAAAVYNIEPPEGMVARFGFTHLAVSVFVDMKVNDDGRYTISSVVRNASTALNVRGADLYLFGVPGNQNGSPGPFPSHAGTLGGVGSGAKIPLLTLGNDCDAPQTASVRARSWQNPDRWVSDTTSMPQVTGCDKVPFNASLEMAPDTDRAASPAGFTAELRVPQESDFRQLSVGLLKKVEVTLPEGVAVNPGSAQGLVGCTDAQAKLRESGAPTCPDASKIGTTLIETPVLPKPLHGYVYLGQPLSQNAANGDMFRIFLAATGNGVTIKQEGRLTPDPVTGQLRAVFDGIPQQPFERMVLKFNGGARAPLTTPTQCGEHTTTAVLTSTAGKQVTSQSKFQIACRDGLFGFAPSFSAGVDNILAGASSPFRLSIAKGDGQRALTGVSVAMPPGLLANLKGNLGRVIGSVRAYAGLGSEPFGLPGTVILEGPYGDAPFSLRVTVPAKAGPYDLGNVVVRQKLYVHPDTAQVTTVSDPLPTILQGVPVQLQRLDLAIDKTGFMINPTSCKAQQVGATLTSEAGQSVSGASRFGIGGCRELAYQPKLDLRLRGNKRELKNGGHPRLDAILTTKQGEANQRTAQVTLPLNLALDPQNAKALCEPSAVPNCPQESVVGKAKAVSILDVPLEGPVYFVRGERKTSTGRVVATLPKLFVPLKGQGVTVNLHASSDVVDRKLQTTFDNLPDAPIERFELQINGGSNGILKVTNGDVCKSTSTPKVGQRLTGQNGKVLRRNTTLGTACRFGVVKATRKGNRVTVTVGGLTGGRVTVSGKGIESNRRTISSRSTVASVGVSLNTASRRALQQGRTLRLRVKVSFKPTKTGAKTVSKTRTVVVKPAKKR